MIIISLVRRLRTRMKTQMTLKKRGEELGKLIVDGYQLGFSSYLMAKFQTQLVEVKRGLEQDLNKRKSFYLGQRLQNE